jgi:hypothetical protein
MLAFALTVLTVIAQSSRSEDNPSRGNATLIIIATLVVAALVIFLVTRFVAKRGSRVPRNEPHKKDHVGH